MKEVCKFYPLSFFLYDNIIYHPDQNISVHHRSRTHCALGLSQASRVYGHPTSLGSPWPLPQLSPIPADQASSVSAPQILESGNSRLGRGGLGPFLSTVGSWFPPELHLGGWKNFLWGHRSKAACLSRALWKASCAFALGPQEEG